MSTTFAPLPSAAAAPQASANVTDVHLAACAAVICVADLLIDCLKLGADVLIVAGVVAAVVIYVAEVSPRRLHGDAASRDTTGRVGVEAGVVVGVDI